MTKRPKRPSPTKTVQDTNIGGNVNLIVMEFTLPCGPTDDPRERMIRTLYAALELLETTEAHKGLPLKGTLRDKHGMTGMYNVTYNP